LALTARSRRCSDSVCFLRDFCRADDAPGRLIFDPFRNSLHPVIPATQQAGEGIQFPLRSIAFSCRCKTLPVAFLGILSPEMIDIERGRL
jgi:hypothetical protein